MSQLPAPNLPAKEGWWTDLKRRLLWSFRAFRAPSRSPLIRLSNGILLDLSTNQLIVEGDFSIKATGNITFDASQHLILQSGGGEVPGRPGYRHSIWFNPPYDQDGQVVQIFPPDPMKEDLND